MPSLILKSPLWLALAASLSWPVGLAAVMVEWVQVGHPANPADASGFGSVDSSYRIAATEVTNAQYAEFLNAVAGTADPTNGADPNGLYNTQMGAAAQGGITRSGDGLTSDYVYAVKPGSAEKAVNFVSIWDAFRFSNWLHNGQLVGAQSPSTTEDGAYAITPGDVAANTVLRQPDATIFLPSENEWYKAAYYDAATAAFLDFPSGSDTASNCTAPVALPNAANCNAPGVDASDADVDGITDVGAFPASPSPIGSLDQGGNVWEWNETILAGAFRGLRGGSADSSVNSLAAETRGSSPPAAENAYYGFRVASLPEPGGSLVLGTGLAGLFALRRRRSVGTRSSGPRSFVGLALATCLLWAPAPSAQAQTPDAACEIVETGQPLTSAQRARMIQLRQRFFGSTHVDAQSGALSPEVAIASWITVTTYALAINGQVLLLDPFIGDDSGYVPTNDCELSGLRPDFVLVGHGHADHAELAPTILNRNRGAVFIGAAEHCNDVTTALASLTVPNCIEAMPRDAALGTTIELLPVIPGVELRAIAHPHSLPGPPDPDDPTIPYLDPAEPKPLDFGPCEMDCPPPRPNFVAPVYVDDGLISILYQLEFGEFVLTFNNTNGPNQPGDPALLAMAALPQTDVNLASILGLNAPINGFRDARLIAERLRARLIVPGHHDYLIPVSGSQYETAFRDEIDEIPLPTRPGIIWVYDPVDYIRPERTTWFVDDPIWSQSAPILP